MSPEQFVVWLMGYLKEHESKGLFPLGFSPAAEAIRYRLSTVVLKIQPDQPGVPGILGQGLMRLEKAEDVAWASADPTEVRVFNGGGCQ